MKSALALVLVGSALPLAAQQQQPEGPPPVLQIYREAIKEGRSAAHEKVETEWAALFRKANFPAHYIALAAMSGSGETWFVQPMPSFEAAEEYDKASEKEPLKSSLESIAARDGELRASSDSIWAVYRPDLSYKPESFHANAMRYLTVGTYHVKLGRDGDFAQGAKTYFGAWETAGLDTSVLGYQVVSGARSGTYLFFSSMASLKTMDGSQDRMHAIQQAMGADKYAEFMRTSGDIFDSIESTLFQVKPNMSYVSDDMMKTDPDFWTPKTTPMTTATRKKKEDK